MKKIMKNNYKKFIALLVIIGIMFVVWKDPINIKASAQKEGSTQDCVEDNVVSKTNINEIDPRGEHRINLEDGSIMEYVITDEVVTCYYYEYVGDDENGEPIYREKTSTVNVLTPDEEDELSVTRGGGDSLHWKKVVKDKFKRDYFYQTGVKGDEMFYRIGGYEKYIINYSKINNTTYVDEYIDLIDEVNKQIIKCIAVAVGAVMIAIAAIVASYVTAGAAKCMTAVSSILNRCGVALVSLSPVSFGHMVLEMYDDYVDLEKKFAMAATYGIMEG